MADVRPPLQKIPPSLAFIRNNREIPEYLREIFMDLVEYLQEDQFFELQLWRRTGGGDDLIESTVTSESYENSFSSAEFQELSDSLEQIEDLIPTITRFNPVIATSNYTAIDLDYVEARNSSVVTLDTKANPGSDIIVANGDGSRIKIVGDVKITRIESQITLSKVGSSLHFKSFGDYWRIV